MGAVVPSFVFDFESGMQVITETEFARFNASDNRWWDKVAKVRTTGKKQEIIAWLLSTAQIRSQGLGGNMHFADMSAIDTTYVVGNAGEGLELTRDQMEDNDGNGFDFAAEWSATMGAYMAYWPQKQTASLIINGTTASSLAYDAIPYFSPIGSPHPVNPLKTSVGSFANQFTGAASGTYPGALPIDESVTIDVALKNLQLAVAYIGSIKMPNGVDPRFLKPRRMLVAPRLVSRAQILVNAKVLPLPATGGAGAADVESVMRNWGFLEPLEVQEFGGISTAQDTTWYLACEQLTSTQLGGLVYVDREPFKITYYTGQGGGTGMDAILDRARTLEWHCQGRNVGGYGHPYALFMCSPT